MKKILITLILLGLIGAATYVYHGRNADNGSAFRLVEIQRGNLLVAISATGTCEPEEVIDVGAQVAGKIDKLGDDPAVAGKTVDYGTAVEQGMILAHIDESLYSADVDQAVAQAEQTRASVRRAQADLVQLHTKLEQAERNWKRAEELGSSRALAATDYDSYRAAYETAKASLAVGEAEVVQVEKGVAQAEASLKRARTNLGYCTIRSPVKGVIIDRRINIGQTVVSSLSAPSMFLIAKDLRRMQVWASVNEADIGMIHRGQPVTFSADAYPGEIFHGEVGKIRLNASMTQNVVTYTVEIHTDNSSGKLLPYLTANVQFLVAEHNSVLMVPGAALRWVPSTRQIVPESRAEYSRLAQHKIDAERAARSAPPTTSPAHRRATVWVQEGSLVRPELVALGVTDGSMVEIKSDRLKEGDEIVIGEAIRNNEDATSNPFTLQFFGGKK